MSIWIAIAGVACSTFLLRASFMLFADPHRFPHWFRHALQFVPAAVLAAIVAPGLVMPAGSLELPPSNLRLVAGLVAMAATFLVRNTMVSVGTGMATLWALQWALGHLA